MVNAVVDTLDAVVDAVVDTLDAWWIHSMHAGFTLCMVDVEYAQNQHSLQIYLNNFRHAEKICGICGKIEKGNWIKHW